MKKILHHPCHRSQHHCSQRFNAGLHHRAQRFIAACSQRRVAASLAILLVVSFLCLPKIGYYPLGAEDFNLIKNILFPLSHANIFHLACNILCALRIITGFHTLIPAFIISFLASLIPAPVLSDWSLTITPIMGASGILFAIIGIRWGRYGSFKGMLSRLWFFFLITAFIPNVAVLFHIYCIIIAYAYGWLQETIRLWNKTSCI